VRHPMAQPSEERARIEPATTAAIRAGVQPARPVSRSCCGGTAPGRICCCAADIVIALLRVPDLPSPCSHRAR
jgi:hypothetical protein